MRYNVTQMTEHASWPIVSVTKSELGSKEVKEVGGGHIGNFVVVIGEDSNGVKLARTKPFETVTTATKLYTYYILIPESHPMFNSNLLVQTFRGDEANSRAIHAATNFTRKKLQELYHSLARSSAIER